MVNIMLTQIALVVYFCAWIVYTLSYLRNHDKMTKIGFFITAGGAAIQVVAFFTRWYESYLMGHGHFPVTDLYEALTFYSMVMAIFYLIIEKRYAIKWTGTFILPVIFLTLAYTSFLEKDIDPLVPALQNSLWLTLHVITSFLGYAGFAVAFAAGILFLIQKNKSSPDFLDKVDATMYVAVGFGFIMLTLGIITGAVWANEAWGSYWSWDPKETWSLITWLVYGALLHGRFNMGWKGEKTAVMSIIGFMVTLFCFLGVNLFLSGLHSYAS